MRLDTVDYRATQAELRRMHESDSGQPLMTPARRAALDALEREFSELLRSKPR